MQSEDNNALPDKNKKRRFKTPDQVAALERFYTEHKYPSEEQKSQFAASVRLTEKQISGWFCHRRLKDKRLVSGEASANGKQDRSSGIIVPDHASGHKQDSCGSTKEGGSRHIDHREVQSRGFIAQNLLFSDLASEHVGKTSDLDDTSSGSSLPLQNRLHSQNEDTVNVTENIVQTKKLMGIRTRAGPAGYLKMKGRAENPAITYVKRQLGRHYLEDGPPLSVEFDPLPPGAFESSINNPVHDPHFMGVPDLQHSPDIPRISNKPDFVTRRDVNDPHLDGSSFRVKPQSHGHGGYTSPQSIQRPVFTNRNTPFPKKNSASGLNEVSPYEMAVYDKRPYSQHNVHGRRKYDTINNWERNPWLHKSENVSLEQAQGQHFESEHSDMENRGLTKRTYEDDMPVKERNAVNESSNSAIVQGDKRVWEEFLEKRCRNKALKAESPLWTNQKKRSAATDTSSSSSEDETAETSSSGD